MQLCGLCRRLAIIGIYYRTNYCRPLLRFVQHFEGIDTRIVADWYQRNIELSLRVGLKSMSAEGYGAATSPRLLEDVEIVPQCQAVAQNMEIGRASCRE